MHAPDNPDPWSSLAESLGVGPGDEPSRQPPPPDRPAPRPAAARPKPKPSAPPPASWDALASNLGIEPTAGEPPPRPSAPPPRQPTETYRSAEPRPPRDDVRDEDLRREHRRHAPPSDDAHEARADRGDERDRRDEGRDRDTFADEARAPGARDGERRGRRRRGRRGGRRDREVGAGREAGAGGPGAARDRDRDAYPRPTDPVAESGWDEERPAPPEGGGERAEGAERRPPVGDGDEDRPRRRRRGRRGGRGRSRSGREPGAERSTGQDREGAAPRTPELDDEPLPTSYGMRPPARPEETRERTRDESGGRRGDAERSGSGSRGRRRRRRGGEARASGGDADRGRRSRRGDGERSGPARSSRVRRADFAPVSGTFDEDDEGLEFLGVEDVDREPRRRAPRTGDDDALAESGLDSVREVPSWVEAIGIVIAGNLDARSRGRGDGGRQRER